MEAEKARERAFFYRLRPAIIWFVLPVPVPADKQGLEVVAVGS